jgi:hypothetical protein
MDVHCTKLPLSKYNGSWVVSMKLKANFSFQPRAMFVFLDFIKMILLKVVYPLKIYQYTKFYGSSLSGASMNVRHLKWLKLRD